MNNNYEDINHTSGVEVLANILICQINAGNRIAEDNRQNYSVELDDLRDEVKLPVSPSIPPDTYHAEISIGDLKQVTVW
ncbi:hypothetical protein LVD17_26065 [Fulvivirga ulvae]|uniref:hypothetical protein n=1 Tax=Fulvivirga ulvae TaxID=2904245 RepID=UPI001F3A9E05|nr:hypothetical protein [Fulvivirga ulvae]UII31758.1 hypothetical protein LVD17_26065 [Fulvivirga ulvae]